MAATALEEALARRRSCRDFADSPVPLAAARALLWAAQGITGEAGGRTAPSAHGLHPLALRLVAGRIEGLEPGIHAVAADTRGLTRLVEGDRREMLREAALEDQPWIARAAGILSLAADLEAGRAHFADQSPAGERGARYLYIEAGAVAQNVQLAAVAAGLGAVLVAGFEDAATAEALGLEPPLGPLLHLCFGWPAIG
ncbi:SagB-type dehydrogenase domain-containing protein [Tistlia consotensis]|uniref:SagB-type dehydrogenase domain-containing protein n=1 Tax=Tistlia consotensis USBA 355 TaxID=560819 RepID=A0A1Y6BRG8_9PROT|nr:nitroreductase family protein [Tistlia consotensis]SMF17148.1 SagB-type dehydrogenase domain-containing protein [Tistlia consotensis USBA 355]SNR40682.1 SagB-type dehydrogenase domain-containing protein [Tistlia consotensis]